MPATYVTTFGATSGVNFGSSASGIQTGPVSAGDSFAAINGADLETQLPITAVSAGYVDATTSGVDVNLATLTNPGGSVNYEPLPGSSPSGKKLYYIWAKNEDPTNGVTITTPAANGLAGLGWGVSDHVARLDHTPGGKWEQVWSLGSSALTPGTNDKLKFTSTAGVVRVQLRCGFG